MPVGEHHGGAVPPREGESVMRLVNTMLYTAQTGAWLIIGALVLLIAR